MQRREFITLLGASAAAWPLSVYGKSRLPLVGVLLFGQSLTSGDLRIAHELARMGYVDGRNITYVVRAAEGDVNQMTLLARELVAAKPDVLVGQASSAAIALLAATQNIPIILTVISDPIALGLTSSISRPTRNVTGFISSTSSLAGKRLEILREIVPSLRRVAYLWGSESPGAWSFEKYVRQAADALGIKLISLPLKSGSDIDDAFERAERENAAAALTETDPLTLSLSSSIADHCLLYGLPCMNVWAVQVRNGALISYGPPMIENNTHAAVYIDRILKGAKISDLPFEEPTKYELAINLKTAKALGLTVPPSLLARADDVIE